MKLLPILALAPLALVALACDGRDNDMLAEVEAADKQATEGVKDFDFSDMNVDALKAKANEIGDELANDLRNISDRASAENVRREVQPALDALSRLKDRLGDNLPDMSDVQRTVDDLEARFADNEEVRSVLDPVLERLRNLTE
ncbi:MAG: hypothetical protein WD226_00180 [Planctomycetota bacterium]